MNKVKMVEELIRAQPVELMLEALWEDRQITDLIKSKLLGISEQNLQPYHEYFIGTDVSEKAKPKYIPLFNGEKTAEYISTNHEG